MSEYLANNAVTTLAASIGYSDSTLTVASSSGFPSPNFRIVVDAEIILVTGVSGTTWTISRGQESTTAAGHTVGASIANVLTVAGLGSAITSGTAATISGSIAESQVTNLTTDLGNKVATSTLGAANGVATLNGSGQLTSSQVPTALVGAVNYQGLWNASTNSPTLVSSTGSKGNYYVVSTAGTTTIDGNSQWNVGDTIIFNGSVWDKIDGVSSEVVSVAGRTGAVVLSNTDISGLANSATIAATNANTPSTIVERDSSGNFSAGTITASLMGHASSDVPTSTTISTTTPLTGGGALSGNLTLGINAASGSAAGTMSSAAYTLVNNATSANTASTIVKRDGSGVINASTFSGNVQAYYLTVFNSMSSDSERITTDGDGNLTAVSFSGDGSGLTGISGGGGIVVETENDTGMGLTFTNAAANIFLGVVQFGISSGNLTLPTSSSELTTTFIIDNTSNNQIYTLTEPIQSATWTVAEGRYLVTTFVHNSIGWSYGSQIYADKGGIYSDGNGQLTVGGISGISSLALSGTFSAASNEFQVDGSGNVQCQSIFSQSTIQVSGYFSAGSGGVGNNANGWYVDTSGNETVNTIAAGQFISTSAGVLYVPNGPTTGSIAGTDQCSLVSFANLSATANVPQLIGQITLSSSFPTAPIPVVSPQGGGYVDDSGVPISFGCTTSGGTVVNIYAYAQNSITTLDGALYVIIAGY